jgi:uncharacterized protein YPO0396
MIPDKIEMQIKVKEFNNNFFKERIETKKAEIKKLQEDCERLEGIIQVNLDRIDKLKETK